MYPLKVAVNVCALWVYGINCAFYICVSTETHINDGKLGMGFPTCNIDNNVQKVLDSGALQHFGFFELDLLNPCFLLRQGVLPMKNCTPCTRTEL